MYESRSRAMDRESIKKVLKAIGAKKVNEQDDKFEMSCIFAPWTHKKGFDRHPSMGIKVAPHGASPWNCFACKAHGWGLKNLLWKLEGFLGKKFTELYPLVNAEPSVRIYDSPSNGGMPTREQVLPESVLDPYKTTVPKYVLNRGIGLSTCRTWGLGYDKDDRRLVIPLRRGDGQLVGLIGRAVDKSVEPKYMNYGHFKKSWYLFGEQFLVNPEAIVLVEGQFDALWLWDKNIRPVVALMGSAISKVQAEKLLKFEVPIILFLDNDKAGQEGIERCEEFLSTRTKTYRVKYPSAKKKEPTDFDNQELVQLIAQATLF
jgi:5S rRNA maturation endonuclease (ribonuclease M5)